MENRVRKHMTDTDRGARIEASNRKILEGFFAKCRRYAQAINSGNDLLAEAIKSDLKKYSNMAYLVQSGR